VAPETAKASARTPAVNELIIPALAVLFTGYFFWTVTELGWEAKANGIVVGSVLLLLVAILLVRIAVRVRQGTAEIAFRLPGPAWANRQRLWLLLLLLGFLVGIHWLGTVLALALLLLGAMWLLGARHWPSMAGVAVAAPLAVWATLMLGIGTRLPHGPFEFAMAALFGLGVTD
jgi:hypothetical protein